MCLVGQLSCALCWGGGGTDAREGKEVRVEVGQAKTIWLRSLRQAGPLWCRCKHHIRGVKGIKLDLFSQVTRISWCRNVGDEG